MDNREQLSTNFTQLKVQKKTLVSEKEIDEISRRITREQHRSLARALGLERRKFEEIERNCTVNQYGDREIVCQMFNEWKKINEKDATNERLVSVLLKLGRTDIVHEIFEDYQYRNLCILKDLQEIQKRKYINLTLPTSLWLEKKWLPLEKLFVELSIVSKDKAGEEEHRPLDQKQIFDNIESKVPHRILIESPPRYGKTTLITKILSDWSGGEKYLKNKFDLVFVISLRNYDGELNHHLLRQCKGAKGKKEEILELLAAVEDRVLLLLDGLDECKEKIKDSLIPLIIGDLHRNMTLVVTCRTGNVHLNIHPDENLKSMSNKEFETFSIWDKIIQIKGISSEKRKEFLQRYLNAEITNLDKKLEQSNLKLSEFYECPLFLLLLAVLFQEKNVNFTESKTDLYKTIFNFVINRSLEKLVGVSQEIDVFDFKALDQFGSRDLLLNFGRLCLEKIKTQSLIFEERELIVCSDGNEMIFKFGILSKQNSFSFHEEKNYYELIHRSFVEFLSAFYLSSLDENKMEKEVKKLLLQFDIWPEEDKLLYLFLGGFLQSNAFRLFNALSPYKSLISIFDNNDQYPYNVSQILLEIPKTVEIVKSVANLSFGDFVKPSERNEYFISNWLIGLTNVYSQNRKKIKISFTLPDHAEFINGLPEDFKLYKVTVTLNHKIREFKLKRNRIQCENLVIESQFCFYSNWKEVLTKIEAKKIWLDIDAFDFYKFCNEMMDGDLSKLRVHHLLYSKSRPFKFTIPTVPICIGDLINRQKIQHGLSARFSYLWNPFPHMIAECENLIESVADSHLSDLRIDVDEPFSLPTNIFKNKKEWKVLELRGENFKLNNFNKNEYLSVEHFLCNASIEKQSYKSTWNKEVNLNDNQIINPRHLRSTISLPYLLLKCKGIKRLSCNYDLVSKLGAYEKFSSWKGFQTIEHLDLWIDEMLTGVDDSLLTVLHLFKNIRELRLFHCAFNKHNFFADFILHLPSLKKVCLMRCSDVIKFIEKINQNQGICLDELKIYYENGQELFSLCIAKKRRPRHLAKCLEECFSRHIFHKFSLFDVGQRKDVVQLMKLFLNKDSFRVSSELVEDVDHTNEFPKLKRKLSITYLDNKK